MDTLDSYLDAVGRALREIGREDIRKVADLLVDAYLKGRQVFVMGNGGSAATASHLACDLQKTVGLVGGRPFRVMALTDNVPLITAWANDFEYLDVFARQLAAWVRPADLVIGISASGNSPNVIRAIELANQSGATSVGLSGCHVCARFGQGVWEVNLAQRACARFCACCATYHSSEPSLVNSSS